MSNQMHEAFPYLRVQDANAAIEFYKVAFGAVEDFRLSEPSGRVSHAELKFGPYTIMVSDEYPEYGIHGPAPDASTGSSTLVLTGTVWATARGNRAVAIELQTAVQQ